MASFEGPLCGPFPFSAPARQRQAGIHASAGIRAARLRFCARRACWQGALRQIEETRAAAARRAAFCSRSAWMRASRVSSWAGRVPVPIRNAGSSPRVKRRIKHFSIATEGPGSCIELDGGSDGPLGLQEAAAGGTWAAPCAPSALQSRHPARGGAGDAAHRPEGAERGS